MKSFYWEITYPRWLFWLGYILFYYLVTAHYTIVLEGRSYKGEYWNLLTDISGPNDLLFLVKFVPPGVAPGILPGVPPGVPPGALTLVTGVAPCLPGQGWGLSGWENLHRDGRDTNVLGAVAAAVVDNVDLVSKYGDIIVLQWYNVTSSISFVNKEGRR